MDRAGDSFRLRNFGLALAVSLSTLLFAANARADQLVVDFTSPQLFDHAASSGIWDTQFPTTGRIWAPYSVAGAATKFIDFGNGSDGDFLDGPSQTGISVSGSIITINTDVKANYQFSSFSLSAGKTIQVTGSQPLVIRVFGASTISGSMNANGGSGATNGSGTNVVIGPIAGGIGVAGGGNGGNGGQTNNTSATSGMPAPRGGIFGSNVNLSPNDAGGGGGCNGAGATNPAPSNASAPGTCASNQATLASNFETTFLGGAGGGGGGAFTNPGQIVGGSGGGAGGGAIRIISLGSITISGTLSANGGVGGANNASLSAGSDCGGGGGGGSGGSLWVQTPYTISGTGVVSMAAGIGGASATCSPTVGTSYNGGNGSVGVFRADQQSATYAGPGTPSAANPVTPPSTAQTYAIVSKPLLNQGYYTLQPPTETQGCGAQGTLTVAYEGSNDGVNFQSGVPAAQISQLSNYPYIRFRVTIAATGANPPCLTGLTIPYTLSTLSDLTIKGGLACGTIRSDRDGKSGGKDRSGPSAIFGDLLLLGLAFFFGKRRKKFVHP